MLNRYFFIACSFLVLLAMCTKEEWLFDVSPDENLELPLLLDINQKSCALDMPSKTFRYPINATTVANFEALVEFQDYSRVIFNGIELENGEINDFGEIEINTLYDIIFITEGEKNKFSISFSLLPTVQLITKDRIIDEPKSYARLILNYPDANMPSVNTIISVENRGASSLYNPKKSHGLKLLNSFDQDNIQSLPLFGQKSNSKWVLDAMYIDEAKARNKMGMDLWQTFPNDIDHLGVPGGNYVEVFRNHQSMGLYCFHETLSYDFLDANPESVLITGKKNKPDTFFQEHPDESPQGAYWESWEQKIPHSSQGNNWDAFEALSKLIAESSNEEFVAEIANHIDLDNVIDYYIYVNITQAYDNVGKNWYFFKKNSQTKFVIIPWDMDSTWGRDHTGTENGIGYLTSNTFLARLIIVNPDNYKQRLQDRWEELKYDQLSTTSLSTLFNNNLSTLNENNIIDIDNRKWNINTNLVDEQLFLENFIQVKWSETDHHITNL